METRARYILIGAFTLAGVLGLLGFLLWFARVELDRQFAYYDISFSSVSGLSSASDVRFSGLPVGQVVDVRLSPDRDGSVRVRIEVGSDTPVRTDSIATIEAQGITGVSFVGITAGSPEAELLVRTSDGSVPEIEAGRSVLQTLSEDAPELLDESLGIVRELNAVLSGENRGRVERILENVEGASGNFAQSLEDFSEVAGSVSEFAVQIDSFNTTLADLTGGMTDVLDSADEALVSITTLADESRSVLAAGTDALVGVEEVVEEAERYVVEDLTPATEEIRLTVATLRGRIDSLGEEASAMIGTFAATGVAATARLTEAEQTLAAAKGAIARLDTTMAAMGMAATDFDTLIVGDATALVTETRAVMTEVAAAVEVVGTAARTDLPLIVADIHTATAILSSAATEVGANLTVASGRIDGLAASAESALAGATLAFANANDTLAEINTALVTGERALLAAERAFAGADRVINEEAAGIAEELRATLTGLDTAVAQVAADLPQVSADVRAASAAARSSFTELERVVTSSGTSVEEFMTTALPSYQSLAQETRSLIANLDILVTQVQRDPLRFLLNE